MSSGALTSFLGALQAGLSVLLVIFYGVVAAQFNLIDNSAAKKMSSVCVKIFLPFLLITNVGSELHLSNASKYAPILVWTIVFNVISMAIGYLLVKLLKQPMWIIPAITFNNTTSLPLLLIQSLESTGILQSIVNGDEKVSKAITRAQSYFLVAAVVSNCLTFALGPRLLDEDDESEENEHDSQPSNGELTTNGGSGHDEPQAPQQNNDEPEETTSLLPERLNEIESQVVSTTHHKAHSLLHAHKLHPTDFHPRSQTVLSILYSFINAPLIGAAIGAVIGLTPPLHRAFFNDSTPGQGGIFTAWLTSSLKSTGQIFVTLQVILVGVKLSSSLRKLKRGETGPGAGRLPWSSFTYVFIVRYIVWPAISIPLVYLMATKTNVLGKDRDGMLWFTMMLMPVGPPAMNLVPMADVSGKDEGLKMSISRMLTGMYALSPVLAASVVGALSASQSAMGTA